MKRNILEQILLYDYRYLIAYTILVITGFLTHLWRLGSDVPGLGQFESEYISSLSWARLIENPLYWPHKVLTLFTAEQFVSNAFWLRLVSVVFAVMAALIFFYLIRNRFRDRVAIIAVGLLVTSSWWLHFARIARPEILIPLSTFGLMLLAKKAYESPKLGWLILLVVLIGASLYIPSMPYLIMVGAFITRSLIKQVWRGLKTPVKSTLIILFVVLTVPLLYAIGRDLTLTRELLLLPDQWVTPLAVFQEMLSNVGELFWNREPFWALGLGSLPYLDLFTAVMVALGLYHLDQEISRSLAYFVLVGFGLLLILVSLNPTPVDSIVLLPFLYILVAAGIVMLLTQWYEIFPRNPIARLTAFIPTAFLLLAVVWYHQQRFFIAWPQAPEIVNEFPPLGEDITKLAERNNGDVSVFVHESQINIVQASLLSFPQAAFTSEPLQPPLPQHPIISNQAFESLPEANKTDLGGLLKPVATPYATAPISIWVRAE